MRMLMIGGLAFALFGCSSASSISKQEAESMAASYLIGAEVLDRAAESETDSDRKLAIAVSSAELQSQANLLQHAVATGKHK